MLEEIILDVARGEFLAERAGTLFQGQELFEPRGDDQAVQGIESQIQSVKILGELAGFDARGL